MAAARKIAEESLPEQQVSRLVAVQLACRQAAVEAATRFARYRAILYLNLAVFLGPQELEYEWSLFSVQSVRSSSEIITRKSAQEKDCCHVISAPCEKIPL